MVQEHDASELRKAQNREKAMAILAAKKQSGEQGV